MNESIVSSLYANADNSLLFHENTESISLDISQEFSCWADVNVWGNYSCCDKITIYFNHNDVCKTCPTNREKHTKIVILISSKGCIFTILCYIRDYTNVCESWKPLGNSYLPCRIEKFFHNVINFMKSKGYHYIYEQKQLNEIVPDRFTELDDSPATVFEVLFGEII